MDGSEQAALRAKSSFIVQCSADTFDHAAWLAAIFSEVLAINEENHRLRIFPLTDMLRGQFEKLGAIVTSSPALQA
jgi:hypothetical protein